MLPALPKMAQMRRLMLKPAQKFLRQLLPLLNPFRKQRRQQLVLTCYLCPHWQLEEFL
jgi:hypothetical protein